MKYISGNHSPKPSAHALSSQAHQSQGQAVSDGFPNPSKNKGILRMPSGRAAEKQTRYNKATSSIIFGQQSCIVLRSRKARYLIAEGLGFLELFHSPLFDG